MPHIHSMTQETLSKFLEGMRIDDIVYYDNPEAVHFFLISPSPVGRTRALLAITAQDGILSIDLQGPDVPESPHDAMPAGTGQKAFMDPYY